MATYSFNIKSQPKTKYGSKLNAAAHFDYTLIILIEMEHIKIVKIF